MHALLSTPLTHLRPPTRAQCTPSNKVHTDPCSRQPITAPGCRLAARPQSSTGFSYPALMLMLRHATTSQHQCTPPSTHTQQPCHSIETSAGLGLATSAYAGQLPATRVHKPMMPSAPPRAPSYLAQTLAQTRTHEHTRVKLGDTQGCAVIQAAASSSTGTSSSTHNAHLCFSSPHCMTLLSTPLWIHGCIVTPRKQFSAVCRTELWYVRRDPAPHSTAVHPLLDGHPRLCIQLHNAVSERVTSPTQARRSVPAPPLPAAARRCTAGTPGGSPPARCPPRRA